MLKGIIKILFVLLFCVNLVAQRKNNTELLFFSKKAYFGYAANSMSANQFGEYANFFLQIDKIKVSKNNPTRYFSDITYYLTLNRYETNFSTYDTTLVIDSVQTSNYNLKLDRYKYGSVIQYKYSFSYRTLNLSLYNTYFSYSTFTVGDIGCFYDNKGYPLVDINGEIIYPNN